MSQPDNLILPYLELKEFSPHLSDLQFHSLTFINYHFENFIIWLGILSDFHICQNYGCLESRGRYLLFYWGESQIWSAFIQCRTMAVGRGCRISNLIRVPINFWQNFDLFKKRTFFQLKNWQRWIISKKISEIFKKKTLKYKTLVF